MSKAISISSSYAPKALISGRIDAESISKHFES